MVATVISSKRPNTLRPFPSATESSKKAQEALRGQLLAPLVDFMEKKINEAAKSGRFEINHPLRGFTPWPELKLQKELWDYLRAHGYKVTEHSDPDPGHPASGPYTSVSWALSSN